MEFGSTGMNEKSGYRTVLYGIGFLPYSSFSVFFEPGGRSAGIYFHPVLSKDSHFHLPI